MGSIRGEGGRGTGQSPATIRPRVATFVNTLGNDIIGCVGVFVRPRRRRVAIVPPSFINIALRHRRKTLRANSSRPAKPKDTRAALRIAR